MSRTFFGNGSALAPPSAFVAVPLALAVRGFMLSSAHSWPLSKAQELFLWYSRSASGMRPKA